MSAHAEQAGAILLLCAVLFVAAYRWVRAGHGHAGDCPCEACHRRALDWRIATGRVR